MKRLAVVFLFIIFVAGITTSPGVSAQELDTPPSSGVQTGDPSSSFWALDRIDQNLRPLDGEYHWDTDGAGVHIFVIDSGVSNSNEFGDRLLPGMSVAPGGGICWNHGTRVAKMAAGETNGVAKSAFIVPVNIYHENISTDWICDVLPDSRIVSAVERVHDYVLDNNVEHAVVNISQGWSVRTTDVENDLEAAIRAAIADGIEFVVAAGNYGGDACSYTPGRMPEVLTVGALAETNLASGSDRPASFSERGDCVDIWAPGENTLGGDGTSFAAPLVAGVMALSVDWSVPESCYPGWNSTTLAQRVMYNAKYDADFSDGPSYLLQSILKPCPILDAIDLDFIDTIDPKSPGYPGEDPKPNVHPEPEGPDGPVNDPQHH